MAHSHAHAKAPARAVRLAECESIAVDRCPCGTLQLHLGALTLRLDADSMAKLLSTVGRALVRAQKLDAEHTDDVDASSDLAWGRSHGDA